MDTIEYRNLPAVIKSELPQVQLPENYQRAVAAIAECFTMDECKEWANKAAAAASYYKQSKDHTMEEQAKRIRLRALLRCYELIKELGDPVKGPGTMRLVPGKGRIIPAIQDEARKRIGVPYGLFNNLADASSVPRPKREVLIEHSPPISLQQLAREGRGEGEPKTSKHDIVGARKGSGVITYPPGFPNSKAHRFICDVRAMCLQLDAKKEAMSFDPKTANHLKKTALKDIEEWFGEFEKYLPVSIKRKA